MALDDLRSVQAAYAEEGANAAAFVAERMPDMTAQVDANIARLNDTLAGSLTICTVHVLYCTVLYCTVLYCTVLYCTVHVLSRG